MNKLTNLDTLDAFGLVAAIVVFALIPGRLIASFAWSMFHV